MPEGLKGQLTSWFVGLFIALYCFGGILGLIIFDSVLTNQLDEDIQELSSEITPSIEFFEHKPTLKTWAAHLSNQHQILLATIQIYDINHKMLEAYGPDGVNKLSSGTLTDTISGSQKDSIEKHKISVRSAFKPLREIQNERGFLQVQVSTKYRDDALHQFGFTLLILAPFFATVVWLAGRFFSEKAVSPVNQTMALLRRFVADAGHEFNTPITVIEASVQTLQETFTEHGLETEILEVITRASARMKDLSTKLMLLAKMENPELVSKMKPIYMPKAMKPIMEEFSSLALQRNIEITWSTAADAVAWGNEDSLRTMISNLLENSVRYTESGGIINSKITTQDGSVTISIEDSGVGIPAESIPHIYERFYRVEKSRSRAVGGSGLGLSIVKAIVEAHRGVIKVESQLGIGSKFTVVIPPKGQMLKP